MPVLDPSAIIATLGMRPHPEGGHYVETFKDAAGDGRPASTAIYYLLKAGERSHWHRVDAAEVWHHYAGAPLALSLSERGDTATRHVLGPDLPAGERPQVVVPAGVWQAAESLGDWTLVGCTVAPGFRFEGFEMAAPGWAPGEA
ncbi:cupin domain-containing protein [Labrys wisconsinensis]|uniref:Cupin superfamily sugar epimerase n=1 Tax=Labrys wisconsinensis TaxID=425677 RepID=A0ABU0JK81_9HYPH|nr:cupin domain-containing protein [Labrys wisconsinensis]MDQ0474697.1 putative cupin superfamily sugar epimerase [Labrys wisconsinensis]